MKNQENNVSNLMNLSANDLMDEINKTLSECAYTVTHTTLRQAGNAVVDSDVMKKIEEAVLDTTLADIGNNICDAAEYVVEAVRGLFTDTPNNK